MIEIFFHLLIAVLLMAIMVLVVALVGALVYEGYITHTKGKLVRGERVSRRKANRVKDAVGEDELISEYEKQFNKDLEDN